MPVNNFPSHVFSPLYLAHVNFLFAFRNRQSLVALFTHFFQTHPFRFPPTTTLSFNVTSSPSAVFVAFHTADNARSLSSDSELYSPMKHHQAPPSLPQDPRTNSPVAWCPAAWNQSGNISSTCDINPGVTQTSTVDNMFSRDADVTALIYSSSSSTMESSAEEAAVRRHQQNVHRQASRHRHRHNRGSGSDRHRTRSTAKRDENTTEATVVLLRSELEATRSQVEQKEVVMRSLQRQLDQVCFRHSSVPNCNMRFAALLEICSGCQYAPQHTPNTKYSSRSQKVRRKDI